MILYFVNRASMEIAGQASTSLRNGFTVINDLKTEDVETGTVSFEATIGLKKENQLELEAMAEVGNYLLRNNGEENEVYTIVESEIDTKNRELWIYAEDAGLDLINEQAAAFEATSSQNIEYYINNWIVDSGFEIGINECPDSTTRKLSWDGETTVTERLASIATQFGDYEISYSFAVSGMRITNRYVNIHKQRGKDVGVQLRLNKEIDRIITKKSITNLATALKCTGGTPEDAENPITLNGYTYDDGDFYVSGSTVYSRKAAEKWGRFGWAQDINPGHDGRGYILRHYSYDTTSQATLCSHAIAELKKYCDMEVNYEVDITKLDAKVGDRVNIIDDAGELYLSTRILQLETSETRKEKKATLGEHLIKSSGISQKVEDLAAKFAENANSAAKALQIANTANETATAAKEQADTAAKDAAGATQAAQEATQAAQTATESAEAANTAAENAQKAVDVVEENVAGLEQTVADAEAAAEQARQAAETAQTKADEAHSSAVTAQQQAQQANEKATQAETAAQSAGTKAETATGTAAQAKEQAEAAATKAEAAKLDAEQAKADIVQFESQLTTWTETLEADYARKTELTEAEEKLQVQITKNAAGITENFTKITVIDGTANNAAALAQQAQNTAQQAQEEANAASEDAAKAQTAADAAAANAKTAQDEADAAKAAASTAQGVADKAAQDLAAAEADLATVTGRVDATEAEIQAAQEAVNAAQSAADKAQADADTAAEKATTAQNKADTAAQTAANAQTAADNAASAAQAAQAAADKAQGDATAAKNKADEAAEAAAAAQETANTAKTNAATAQSKANEAAQAAVTAQQAADDADAKAAQAQADLLTAQNNLAAVTGRVDATEEEIEQAKKDVETAQAAAEAADAEAKAAQAAADKAKADAATAQTAADNAKAAADKAQEDATAAKNAADKAQEDVDNLKITVTEQGTEITKKADKIELEAYKTEVTTTLGGYYTKEEADSKISVSANGILSEVSNTYTTKQEMADLEIGGRNLYRGTADFSGDWTNIAEYTVDGADSYGNVVLTKTNAWLGLFQEIQAKAGELYTLSVSARGDGTAKLWFYVSEVLEDGTENTYGVKDYGVCPTTETRFAETWEVKTDCTLRFRVENSIAGYNLWVSSLKLEKGNKATDWTPAPEDVDAATNEAQSTADAAQERILSAESSIEQLANAISMLVTDENGTTLLEQTSEGWSFNLADVSKALVEANQALHGMQETVGTVEEGETVRGMIDALGQLIDDVKTRTAYIDMKTDENGDPVLELGKRNDSDGFKVAITNSTITFKLGAAEPPIRLENRAGIGYVIADKLIVEDEYMHGDFKWILHDGNLGLL